MQGRSCFKTNNRLISRSKEKVKGDTFYTEEVYSFHIERDTERKKYKWLIVLERYEKYKVIVISFHLSKHSHNKGIKKYKRNRGYRTEEGKKSECIDPFMVLRLFKECFSLCTEREENTEYSFCFYAIDDEYIEHREDINKRMSAYYTYLNRKSINLQYKLKHRGNIYNNLYVGYNEDYCTEQDIDRFIEFYEPILLEEIKELFAEQDSQKL